MLWKSSVVALYWKKWCVRLLAACLLSRLKNYREKMLACLFSTTWIIYPLISVFSLSLNTPSVLRNQEIDKMLKTKTKRKRECPHRVDHLSNALLLLTSAAEGHALLLSYTAVTEAVPMSMEPLKRPRSFLQADFPRVGKREWDLCTDILEELIHLQSRHWAPPSHPHPWCVRASGVSDKAYCTQISFCTRWNDLAP